MVWDNPRILLCLWILPLVAGLFVYAQRRRAAAARQFAAPGMLGRLMPPDAGWRPWVKGGLVLLGLACLIAAGARPRFGVYFERVSQKGADLVVLLDVSRSMTAEDVPPSRLQRAKLDVIDLLGRLAGDRVGLVVFAGKPVTKVPLTTDYGFFRMVLDEVGPHSAPRGGTLIGDGIRKCLEALPEQRDRDQVIVLITDGDDQDSYVEEAAKQAAERGIKVFCVGLGDASEGARIPVREEKSLHYLKDGGKEVWSKLNEGCLQKVALATGGAYIPAGTRVYDLGQIYTDHLAKLTRGQVYAEKRKRYRDQFQWFVGLGLALLLAEMLIASYPRPTQPSSEPGRAAPARMKTIIAMLILLSTAASASAEPAAATKVQEGITHYQKGNYSGALTAFDEAAKGRPDDLRIAFDRACALAASNDMDKAIELFQKAAVSQEPTIAVSSRYNLGNLAVAKARALFGEKPQEASPQVREEGLALLTQAAGRYRDCLEIAPDHADARHNLELVRLWTKQMKALWQERDRQKKPKEMNLLEFLAMLDARQRELRTETRPLLAEADSPKRRQALADLKTSQRELAKEIEPLKEKLAAELQPPAKGGGKNEALDLLTRLADKAHETMTAAADRLAAGKPAEAVGSQTDAVERFDEIYRAIVPFVQLVQRALKDQQGLVDGVSEVVASEEFQKQFDHRESAWDQKFVARWNELLPAKATLELKQLEAAPPPSDKNQDAKAAEEAKQQCECVKKALKKAIEFGPEKLRKPAAEAAILLEAKKPSEALPQQKESLKLLQEIADLLPKQNKKDQDPQQDKKQQDQNRKDQKQNKKNEQPKDQKQPQKPQQSQKQDASKQQAESTLRKARQRQQYRREMERRLQQYILRPEPVEKDW
jgi:Ca-activated chloride channel family protein